MKGRTHFIFAFLISILIINFFNILFNSFIEKIFFTILVLFFSLFPDIDHPGSKIGKKVKPLSFLLKIFVGHRSIFHSVFVPIILYILFLSYNNVYALAILIGYLSHLILDSFTYSGIRWFYPLQFQIKGVAKSGGILDWFLFMIFCIFSLFFIVKKFL